MWANLTMWLLRVWHEAEEMQVSALLQPEAILEPLPLVAMS